MAEVTAKRRSAYIYDQNMNSESFQDVYLDFHQESGDADENGVDIMADVQLQQGDSIVFLTKSAAIRMAKDILLEAGETLPDYEGLPTTGCLQS